MSEQRTTPRTVLELLRLTTSYLAGRGVDSPRLDAEVLLAHVLAMDRVGLYVNFDRPLELAEVDDYREAVARRGRREPVAYITGEKEFMGRPFAVSDAVLIPRPETELLAEAVLKDLRIHGTAEPPRLLDMGTGSGIIAITLAILLPEALVTAVDLSAAALAIAASNADRHGVADRVRFVCSDLFARLPVGSRFHYIVSNPPYIPDSELRTLPPEVQKEPSLALSAGPDGLALIRRLVAEALSRLEPGGLLALEIGADQGAAVRELAGKLGYSSCEVLRDYAGHERVALLHLDGIREV